MATTTTYGLGSGLQGATGAPIVLDASSASADGNINLPDGFSPYSADFVRSGTDLTLTSSDGQTVVIRDYFASDDAPTLVATDGGSISGDLASRLAGPLAPAQTAQATPDLNSEPIGSVQTLTGTVSITRTDGTREDVSVGTPVFQGDILESGDDGAIGVVLADETTFSMSENGRMVLDEMVYDPGTQTGSLAISVVEGVFTFVSGEIAKTSPEAMTVATPVATIGIRGTQVGISFKEGSGLDLVLMEESDGFVGEVVVQNDGGVQILNLANQGTAVANQNAAPDAPITVDRNDIAQTFGGSLGVLPASAGANSYGVEPPAEIQGETAAEEQLEAAAEEEVEEEVAIEEELADFETAAGGEPPAPPAAPPPPAPEPEPEPEPEPIVFVAPEPEPEPEDDGGDDDDDDDEEDNAPPPNVDPLAANDTDVIDEDTSLTFTAADLLANDTDPDGGTLSIVSISAPQHGTLVNNGNGTWTYTPDANFHGVDSLTYTVSDGQGGTDTATATAYINSINDLPELIGGVDEDMLEDGDTISGVLSATDIESDDLTFSLANGGEAQNGTATVDADGTWTYTPDADFSGDDTFTYQVTDENGGTATATATIAVANVAEPIVLNDDYLSLDEDTSITFSAADLLGNDGGDDLNISSIGVPENGNLVHNGDETWTYTPDENFEGVDSLTYSVSSGDGDDSDGVAFVTNDTISTAQTISRGQFGVSESSDVGDDSDPHVTIQANHTGYGDVDFYAFTLQEGEVLTLDIDQGYTYDGDWNEGADDVDTMLWVYDSNGNRVGYNDDYSTNAGGEGSDSGLDSYHEFSPSTAGTYYVAVTGYYQDPMADSYTGDYGEGDYGEGQSGYEAGTYTLNASITPTEDSTGFGSEATAVAETEVHSDLTATLTLDVNGVDDAPVLTGSVNEDMLEDSGTVSGYLSAYDVDNFSEGDYGEGDSGSLMFSLAAGGAAQNGHVTVDENGQWTYTPNDNFSGTDTFTYQVTDESGLTDTATATVTVAPVDDGLDAMDDTFSVNSGSPITFTAAELLANDDRDSDHTLTIISIDDPENGSLVDNGNGSWTYTPDVGFSGADTFSYTVSTGDGENQGVGIISNDTIATAQSIARSDFGIAPSVDVGNDDVPRVEIRGEHTGRGDIDFFAFDLKAGEVLTLDIDYGLLQGVSMDTMLWVYNEAGTRVGYNDDTSSYVGGQGSIHSYDSFVNLTIQTDGTYYAAVTGYRDDPMSSDISGYATGDYVLNTSITPTADSTGFGTVPQVIYDSDGSNFIITDELSEADVTINVDSGTDANVIMGGAGDDTMYGTGNSDTFIGGDGFDTAIMGGAFDDYTVTTDADGNLVLSVDDEGEAISDTLIGVEQVNFEDRNNDGDNSSSYSVSTDDNGGVTLEPDLIA